MQEPFFCGCQSVRPCIFSWGHPGSTDDSGARLFALCHGWNSVDNGGWDVWLWVDYGTFRIVLSIAWGGIKSTTIHPWPRTMGEAWFSRLWKKDKWKSLSLLARNSDCLDNADVIACCGDLTGAQWELTKHSTARCFKKIRYVHVHVHQFVHSRVKLNVSFCLFSSLSWLSLCPGFWSRLLAALPIWV